MCLHKVSHNIRMKTQHQIILLSLELVRCMRDLVNMLACV